MSRSQLPRDARDVFALDPGEWLLFHGCIAFCRATGLWRYPIRAEGDLERMRRMDRIYWHYKAGHPVRRAVRGSGLEAFFAEQASFQWPLPDGFEPSSTLSISSVGDLM